MFGAKKKKFAATQLEDGDSVWNLSAQWTKFRLIVSLTAKRGATLEIIRKYNVRNAREVEGRQTDGRRNRRNRQTLRDPDECADRLKDRDTNRDEDK
jgi:hypothetical protein